MPKPKSKTPLAKSYPFRLRRSAVHGTGCFATRTIRKGTRIIEYVGEHITHDEADRRHAEKTTDASHTFLFTIDAKVVIDATTGGNDSKWINHSCDPNCEVILVDGRPIVEALRTLREGEELVYDYNLTRDPEDDPEAEKVFACRCGAATCRGTMLTPRRKPKTPAQKRAATKKAAAAEKRAARATKTKTKVKTKAARKRPVAAARKRPVAAARKKPKVSARRSSV